jgi:hypothetical protein
MLTNIVYLSAVLANIMAPVDRWDSLFPDATAGDVLAFDGIYFKRTTSRGIIGFDNYEGAFWEAASYHRAVYGNVTHVSVVFENMVPPPNDEDVDMDLN